MKYLGRLAGVASAVLVGPWAIVAERPDAVD
jgi:hypothetical protein